MIDLELIEQGQNVFLNNDKVYIVVGGLIQMKSHKYNHELPKTMASYRYGSILNIM